MPHLVMRIRAALMRLVGLGTRGSDEIRMRDEMAFHLEQLADRYTEEGLPPEEARRRARIAFGGVEEHKETSRDVLRSAVVENALRDVRHALRALRRRPGFMAGVVLTLALGIGANTAMFGIVDRLLFRPPPMLRDASRIHRVYLEDPSIGTMRTIPYARFVDLTRDTKSFSRTAEFIERPLAVGAGAGTREMQVAAVSASFFGFFDAPPATGRYFVAAEDRPPAGAQVAVLSYGFWQTRYGGRRDVLGSAIHIGAQRYTIVGVAPKGFSGLWPERPPAAFVPLAAYAVEAAAGFSVNGKEWWTTYRFNWAMMLVERKPGVGLDAADADLTHAYAQSVLGQRPAGGVRRPQAATAGLRAIAGSVLAERGPNESSIAKVATWVGGVAMIVWLIACANVVTLVFTRALERRREIAVRLALGVRRGRLAAQLLTETMTLAVLGGVAGLAMARLGGAVLGPVFLESALGPTASSVPSVGVFLDPRTLAYAGAAALAAGLLAGLFPLLQARKADLTLDLRAGAREGRYQRSRLRSGLLVFQTTLAVALLVGAGLFVRSLDRVRAVRLGYDPDRVIQVDLNLRDVQLDSARMVVLLEQLRARAATLPGVLEVARQLTTPFWGNINTELHVAGRDSAQWADLNAVSPGYFATMGTRILHGRGITREDVAGAPDVMVLSESLARTLWPQGGALGRCVRVFTAAAPCTTVVGIAEDIKNNRLANDSGLLFYLSAAQAAPDQGGLFVRVRGNADAMREPIRKALQPLMPGAAYVSVLPLSDIVGRQTRSWRVGAAMFVVFGLLALALAAVGLYSVMAFTVTQRTHELGVRVALGARAADVAGFVIAGAARLAGTGIVLGVGCALLAGRWVGPLLFQESPHDPLVFGIVAAVLLGVAVLASYVPARRAARVDPVIVLREE